MSELFDTYEQDLQLALQEAHAKLGAVSDLADRTGLLQAVEHATDEALEILEQMNLEVRNLPALQRAAFNARIRQHRADVDGQKKRLHELLDEDDRLQLFGQNDQRRQLLSNHAAMEQLTERLRESQRVALETEGIGGNILNDLRAQREQIVNSRNTLLAADTYVDKSILTLKSMSRRIVANKFISYAIIAVLILLIFLLLASKFW